MTTTHLEREAKLTASNDFSLARLPNGLGKYVADPAEFRRLHTTYYDTRDLRLARWYCSLRFRVGEGWTLKLLQPGTDKTAALQRKEYTFAGDAGEIPARALDLARAYLRGATVAPVAEIRTLRSKRLVRRAVGGETIAELADDDVRVLEGTTVLQRFRQVEIE